jgi:hypothetical protein
MGLREAALGLARFAWADFFWALDADVLLANPDVLQVQNKGLYINKSAGRVQFHNRLFIGNPCL